MMLPTGFDSAFNSISLPRLGARGVEVLNGGVWAAALCFVG